MYFLHFIIKQTHYTTNLPGRAPFASLYNIPFVYYNVNSKNRIFYTFFYFRVLYQQKLHYYLDK